MTTINLKDFYSWHTHDEYIEVSDEVAAELRADKLYEAAYQRRQREISFEYLTEEKFCSITKIKAYTILERKDT